MKLIDRFLKYVSFETTSDEESGVTPSTPGQMEFAKYLKKELESIGLQEVFLDNFGYLYATLPANTDKQVQTVGFIAHMDTSPDMWGKNVSPRIVRAYDGGDIVLNAVDGITLSPTQFPELKNHVGEDLIVTDGNTLLGADDKAGIAEIITGIEYLMQHPEWTGEAICVDKQPGRALYFISQLGMETTIGGESPVDLNGTVQLKVGKIDLPNLEVVFTVV